MTAKEIKEEIENMKWLINNTSPTWDEMEFFISQIDKLEKMLK
jgi:hypothetical protein